MEENLRSNQTRVNSFAKHYAKALRSFCRKSFTGKDLQFSEFVAKMLSMDKKQLLAALKESRATIDLAIRWVKNSPDEDTPEQATVGECLYCKQPILEGQGKIRGTHRKPCYNEMQTMARNGTVEDLEVFVKQGRLGPVGQLGRPKKTSSTISPDIKAAAGKTAKQARRK